MYRPGTDCAAAPHPCLLVIGACNVRADVAWLQVLISLTFCVPVGLLLAALSAVIHYLRPVLDDAVHSGGISSSDPTLRSVNAGLGGAMVRALFSMRCSHSTA